jgi:hypothetical protein
MAGMGKAGQTWPCHSFLVTGAVCDMGRVHLVQDGQGGPGKVHGDCDLNYDVDSDRDLDPTAGPQVDRHPEVSIWHLVTH